MRSRRGNEPTNAVYLRVATRGNRATLASEPPQSVRSISRLGSPYALKHETMLLSTLSQRVLGPMVVWSAQTQDVQGKTLGPDNSVGAQMRYDGCASDRSTAHALNLVMPSCLL